MQRSQTWMCLRSLNASCFYCVNADIILDLFLGVPIFDYLYVVTQVNHCLCTEALLFFSNCSQTGICIPLPITRNDFAGHNYSFGVLIIFNFILFIFIAAGQAAIYITVQVTRGRCRVRIPLGGNILSSPSPSEETINRGPNTPIPTTHALICEELKDPGIPPKMVP